ncbi:MAG: tyrosine-type recombinase/integrase [Methylococcaceae bacterium]
MTVNAASKSEIDMVHAALTKKYRPIYADLWKIGVNLSLRIGDLLKLKYTDCHLTDRSVELIEKKTGKPKHIRLNNTAIAIIEARRTRHPTDIYLFQVDCNRAKDQAISRVSVSRTFKECGDMLGLNINTHSMRKSRGMALYQDGVPIEKIAKVLNHSSTSTTMAYLGITQEEVLQTYDDYEL